MMAPATPTMLPVPTVAARAVHRDWNWEMDWSWVWPDTSLWKMEPMVCFIQWPKWLIWKNFVRQVMNTPTKASRIRAGQPQTMLLRNLLMLAMASSGVSCPTGSAASASAGRLRKNSNTGIPLFSQNTPTQYIIKVLKVQEKTDSFHFEKLGFQKTPNTRRITAQNCWNRQVNLPQNSSAPGKRTAGPFPGGGFYCPSSSFKMAFTLLGLALPFSSPMTRPTRKPKAFSLPPL